MYFNSYRDENRGVSPVIAVILMVAITVILAAVIGSFVLDIGGSLNEGPPQTTWDVEQANYTVKNLDINGGDIIGISLTYTGGETVDERNINVTVNGRPAIGAAQLESLEDGGSTDAFVALDSSGQLTPGQSVMIIGGALERHVRRGELKVLKKDPRAKGLTIWVDPGFRNADLHQDHGDNELRDITPGDTIRIRYESAHGTSDILYEYTVTL